MIEGIWSREPTPEPEVRARGRESTLEAEVLERAGGGAPASGVIYDAFALRCGFALRAGCCGGAAPAIIDGACAAARVGAEPRQKLTVAAAMNTLEYVPVTMPTIIVNAKPCSTSPPKKNSARAVRSAVPDTITVRPSVWFTDTLMMSFNESRRIPRRFSRIRSKMTIVSLVEKPVIVRIAAITFRVMS